MAKRLKERIQVGEDTNGKPIYEWIDGYSRQELFMKAAAVLQKYGKVDVPAEKTEPHTPYFASYLEMWWKLYKVPKLRHTTRTSYRNAIDLRILPFFKGMRLEDISTNTIQAFYNKHEWMAHSSIHQMSVILHQVFDLAVEDGHMKFNPTESKRLFMKGTKQKREALRDCDVKEIMDKLSLLEAKDRIPLAILLYTGVRRGEALGLRWENLDWKKGVIHIEQAVTFLNNQPVLGETKSDAGIRTVPFDERLMDVLRPYRQIAGFIVGDGITPMTERTFTRMWQRIDRTIDLHGATPHTFRHTYITLAASSGIDVKTLQSIAGHSDIKMTMDRYAHKRDEKIIEAGARIGGVFFFAVSGLWQVLWQIGGRKNLYAIRVKRLLFNAVCGRICGKMGEKPKTT